MGKKLIILILILIIVIPIGVLAADLALTISSFDPNKVSVNHSAIVPVLASDNSSFDYSFSVLVTTPPAGFIPKSAVVTVRMFEVNETISHKIVEEFPLGTSVNKTISGTVGLTEILQAILDSGGSLTFKLKGSITIKILGFEIPGLAFDIPEQTFGLND